MSEKYTSEKFKDLLEETYDWPAEYAFKFIVPTEQLSFLKEILSRYPAQISERASRKGNYTSVTVKMKRKAPEEVVLVYQEVACVKGIVSL